MSYQIHLSDSYPETPHPFHEVPWQVYGASLHVPSLFQVNKTRAVKFLTVTKGNLAVARCAIYPPTPHPSAGALYCPLGGYECIDQQEVADLLLREARLQALGLGAGCLVGPMEDSTWGQYRFCTERTISRFFTEPIHPAYYPDQWKRAGFACIKTYHSFIDTTPSIPLDGYASHLHKVSQEGLEIRSVNMKRWESELLTIAAFSNQAFQENYFFRPVEPEAFMEQNRSLQKFINPEYIQLAFYQGVLVALFFGVVNHLDPTNSSVIVKTTARLKDIPFKGMSLLLASKLYDKWLKLGYTQIIHAFISNGNHSEAISRQVNARPACSYELYQLKL